MRWFASANRELSGDELKHYERLREELLDFFQQRAVPPYVGITACIDIIAQQIAGSPKPEEAYEGACKILREFVEESVKAAAQRKDGG